jgi:H/ACA ribonucleoprotein complex subunit 3
MLLRYHLDANGKRVYTMQMHTADQGHTTNAHPARFSPDDKYSAERIELKTRFNLLPTQKKTTA